MNMILQIKTNEKIKLQVIDKIAHLDYFYMEDEDTCIMLERIGKESDQSILKRFHNLLKIITYMIEIITLLITISTYSIVLALFILLISIPLYHAAMKCGKTDYRAFLESSNNYRRGTYFRRILTARETMEERMIFEYQPYINKKWKTELEHAISIEKKANKKNFIHLKTANIITICISGIIIRILSKLHR